MGNILDEFKTQKMYDKAVDEDPYNLKYIPDQFIHQDMCDKDVDVNPGYLPFVPDHFTINV